MDDPKNDPEKPPIEAVLNNIPAAISALDDLQYGFYALVSNWDKLNRITPEPGASDS